MNNSKIEINFFNDFVLKPAFEGTGLLNNDGFQTFKLNVDAHFHVSNYSL